ncbi:TPA: protein kinase [Salmonella enterica subsp. enterica serovar Ruiru]|nr:protein kinase [Salmonella enterica subsp. enterica serovar Ruiru]HCK3135070.1 protein kinase [Salmonella enterica subsp. enterica serovar Ruiru]
MTYNTKSCSSLEKAYYTPLEAALRWCNLISHEVMILTKVGDSILPGVKDFPQWPCLRINAEKILYAIQNDEIPYGRDGKTVPSGEIVAKHRLTVTHNDLRLWMVKYYPSQKPSFLFDVVEQQLHAGITVDAYQTLQSENKRLNIRLSNAVKTFQQQKHEISELQGERDSLRQMVNNSVQNIDGRSETTYLNIIGGLLNLMLGTSLGGQKQSVFENQGAIISAMLAHFEGMPGISVRTLEGKFSEANKSLKNRW